MPHFFFFSFETIFRRLLFFPIHVPWWHSIEKLDTMGLSYYFYFDVTNTRATTKYYILLEKNTLFYVILMCYIVIGHVIKISAIFWSSCLNFNVWPFPSGIEFISVLIFFFRKKQSILYMWGNHMVSVGKQNKIAVTIIVSIETFTVNETNKSNCLPSRPNETLMFEYVFNIEKCGLDFWNRSEKHEQSLSVVSLALKSLCALKSNRLNYVCYYALESK